MAPVHVAIVREKGQVAVFGINDTGEDFHGELRHGIFTLEGAYLRDETVVVELKANASTRLVSYPESEWRERLRTMPFAMLSNGGKLVARSRMFEPLFHEMAWPSASVEVVLRDGRVVFSSRTFAWNVCLDLDGEKRLADNLFDVYPGIEYSIPWADSQPPRVLYTGNQLPELMRQHPGSALPPGEPW